MASPSQISTSFVRARARASVGSPSCPFLYTRSLVSAPTPPRTPAASRRRPPPARLCWRPATVAPLRGPRAGAPPRTVRRRRRLRISGCRASRLAGLRRRSFRRRASAAAALVPSFPPGRRPTHRPPCPETRSDPGGVAAEPRPARRAAVRPRAPRSALGALPVHCEL